jgi:two-component system LytT family response regulator
LKKNKPGRIPLKDLCTNLGDRSMRKLKVLVADDEYFAREVIKTLLKDYSYIQTIEESATGQETFDKVLEVKPDLLFLDIQMPGINGMDVIRKIDPSQRPIIIFTTAFEQYALQAFEISAVDYLLKPFDRSRFEMALSKAVELIQRKENDIEQVVKKLMGIQGPPQPTVKSGRLSRILIKEPKKMFFIKTEDVFWFEASGDYVIVHMEKKTHLISQSLNQLEAHLNSSDFVRIHRSYIVNTPFISEFEPHFNGEYFITLKNGARLKLSRTYRDRLGFLFADLFDNN